MLEGLLDPKIDFVFKQIFGSSKHPEVLISFLNATLKPVFPIKSVQFENTDLEKQFIKDKFSRLDVKATTSNEEIINIEIQLKNEYNMIKRSLYYWGKLYEEQLGEVDNYTDLKKTVCINILNFKYLKNDRFHNAYRLKEIQTHEELTDVCEIHFIEIPKLEDNRYEKDMLVAWTKFLKNPESEDVRKLEMNIEEIRQAKDELIRLSSDKEQRRLYEIRAKMIKDENSALNKAKEEGIKEGIKEGVYKVAKSLKEAGVTVEIIQNTTGLTKQEIESL